MTFQLERRLQQTGIDWADHRFINVMVNHAAARHAQHNASMVKASCEAQAMLVLLKCNAAMYEPDLSNHDFLKLGCLAHKVLLEVLKWRVECQASMNAAIRYPVQRRITWEQASRGTFA